jgi:hypothetical protein
MPGERFLRPSPASGRVCGADESPVSVGLDHRAGLWRCVRVHGAREECFWQIMPGDGRQRLPLFWCQHDRIELGRRFDLASDVTPES